MFHLAVVLGFMFFIKIFNTPNRPPANFKVIVYQTAIKYGNDYDWEKLFDKANKTTQPGEQLRLFRALTLTKEPYFLR